MKLRSSILLMTLMPGFLHAAPALESKTATLVFSHDGRGIASIFDRVAGREMAAPVPVDLYELAFGEDYSGKTVLRARDAAHMTSAELPDGWELTYRHEGAIPVVVTCRVTTTPDDPLVHWSLAVENQSDRPVAAIEYPRLACSGRLGGGAEAAVLYPRNEGVLLTKMSGPGAKVDGRYPGEVSAQLIYCFDAAGGFYYAAYDGAGHPKDLRVSGQEQAMVIAQRYVLPIGQQAKVALPYEVVTGCFGGRWEAGAEVYREWSDRQEWTKKRIRERDTPAWLKEPVLFINSNLAAHYPTAQAADEMIAAYRKYFGVPVVTTVFSWEKHGTWIGPDYFPANPSDDYYRELAARLDRRGDHLHVYTSGFRWGVRKPVDESGAVPRVYTDYDGRADFAARGRAFTATTAGGEPVFKQPRWADNYSLCTGSAVAQGILADCYRHLYDLGIAGVDLDQNLGGEVEDCFDPAHGHPVGAGLWQTRAMEKFFADIAANRVRPDGKFFQGVEETCERYIPWLDVYHGRSFTATNWPVFGPGAVSVPLYLFLYHPYQIAYAGWIDGGFSPAGYPKYGVGRAYIQGMYPGVRVAGPMKLDPAAPSEELQMLRGAVRLMQQAPEFLLRGRMLGELDIAGSSPLDTSVGRGEKLPSPWSAVQGIGWQSEDGRRTGGALANLSDCAQTIRVRLPGALSSACDLLGYVAGEPVEHAPAVPHDGWLEISLRPWELMFITGAKP